MRSPAISMQTILVQSAYMLLPGAVLYMIMKCERFSVTLCFGNLKTLLTRPNEKSDDQKRAELVRKSSSDG